MSSPPAVPSAYSSIGDRDPACRQRGPATKYVASGSVVYLLARDLHIRVSNLISPPDPCVTGNDVDDLACKYALVGQLDK